MRIGTLAREAGLTADTIRYYERIGLLPAPERSRNRYRRYAEETLDDLRFVQKAQSIGLTLHDIKTILDIARGGRAPCRHVESLVRDRLQDTDRKLRELRTVRHTLQGILTRIAEMPEVEGQCRCAAIETA